MFEILNLMLYDFYLKKDCTFEWVAASDHCLWFGFPRVSREKDAF